MTRSLRARLGIPALALSLLAAGFPLPAAGLPLPAAGRKLYPVDEGLRDRGFREFRERLLAAVRRRDRSFVLGVLDPEILSSFGGRRGVADFRRFWRLEAPDSELWETLEEVLKGGGSFTDARRTGFCAPYVFSRFPDDLDPFEYQAVTGRGVRVRARPDPRAPVVDRLSFDLVRAHPNGSEWIRVVTPSGRTGYVAERYLRSPVDYRACFSRESGRWRMRLLLAGD